MIMRRILLLILLIGVAGCTVKAAGHNCPGKHPKIKNITIVYSKAKISVSPKRPIAYEGGVLRFNLFGKTGKLVKATGKTNDDNWISGSGTKGKFFVCVPSDLLPKDVIKAEYEYDASAAGSPTLDPVVRIRKL